MSKRPNVDAGRERFMTIVTPWPIWVAAADSLTSVQSPARAAEAASNQTSGMLALGQDRFEDQGLPMPDLVLHVTGARPNFPKAAPVVHALDRIGIRQILVHTGQHYDARMSDVFFRQLDLPEPDINLGVGSGSHAAQTAAIMVGLERVFIENAPALVMVYGDVNSTVAAALVGAKLSIPLAH